MGSRGLVRNPRFCWVSAPYCPLQAERLTKVPLPCSWSCDNKFSTGKVNVTVCACTTKSLLSASRRRRRSNTEPMETPPQGYRRNVGICLVNSDMKIFSAVRINLPDAWQLPQDNRALLQGGACEGEDLRNAAIRELREETGVTSAEFLAEAPFWLTYDFPLHVKERLNRRWGTDYKGQAQKWFLFKFTGKDEEINLLGDGSEEPEFNDWSWMLPEEVVELAVYCKRPVYEKVIKLFSPYFQVDGGERNATPGHLLTTPVESKTEILTGNLGRLGVDI